MSQKRAALKTLPQHASPSLRFLLLKLWQHLSRKRHIQLSLLLLVMFTSSAAEVLSLAAVLPFLAVLANPEELWSQPIVQQWASRLMISSADDLLLPITIIFGLAALGAGAIRLLNLWLNSRLAAAIGSDLSCEAYRRTLYQPYSVHLSRNSSDLIATISTDIDRVIYNVLKPFLLLLSSGLISISLVAALVAINWIIAFITGFVIAFVYAIAILISKKPLQVISRQQVFFNQRLIKSLQEGIGAIRDVLLNSHQSLYGSTYTQADRALRRAGADASFLGTYPRLVVEPVGMVLIAVVGFFLVGQQGVSRALPLLGALALGAQRLLPMAQKVYEGWAIGRSSKDSLASILKLLDQKLPVNFDHPTPDPISLKRSVCFESVWFRYGPSLPDVLRGLNLNISRGERIGLIGSTGCGKSTTLDLFMGLLKPSMGRVLVDGNDLHDLANPTLLAAWWGAIAHVPQSIYLSDSSIAENIALGVPRDQISMTRVKQVAKQAQISEFIEHLPLGYESFVGERGIRLSGGQMQRIGIARALYKNAQVLVLDEATSSLDTETERCVMQSVDLLSRDLTIVMIAHRLSTVSRCDRVLYLEHGSVLYEGDPQFVLNKIQD